MSSIFKNTISITIFNVISILLAFLLNVVIAAFFGTSNETDAYIAAITIPIFVQSVLNSGLNVTFIPFLSDLKKLKNEKWRVISSILNINVAFALVISVLIFIFSPFIVNFIVTGFESEVKLLTIKLMKIQSVVIFLTCFNEIFISLYFSEKKFVLPLASRLINPILSIVYILLFYENFSIISIVLASVTGAFFQSIILILGLLRDNEINFKYYFLFRENKPYLIRFYKMMLPLIIGMSLSRSFQIFEKYFASLLPQGSVSQLGYAFKIYSVFPVLVSSGIGLAIFLSFQIL
jgi:putative peptidoglycan lipid II flippase